MIILALGFIFGVGAFLTLQFILLYRLVLLFKDKSLSPKSIPKRAKTFQECFGFTVSEARSLDRVCEPESTSWINAITMKLFAGLCKSNNSPMYTLCLDYLQTLVRDLRGRSEFIGSLFSALELEQVNFGRRAIVAKSVSVLSHQRRDGKLILLADLDYSGRASAALQGTLNIIPYAKIGLTVTVREMRGKVILSLDRDEKEPLTLHMSFLKRPRVKLTCCLRVNGYEISWLGRLLGSIYFARILIRTICAPRVLSLSLPISSDDENEFDLEEYFKQATVESSPDSENVLRERRTQDPFLREINTSVVSTSSASASSLILDSEAATDFETFSISSFPRSCK